MRSPLRLEKAEGFSLHTSWYYSLCLSARVSLPLSAMSHDPGATGQRLLGPSESQSRNRGSSVLGSLDHGYRGVARAGRLVKESWANQMTRRDTYRCRSPDGNVGALTIEFTGSLADTPRQTCRACCLGR